MEYKARCHCGRRSALVPQPRDQDRKALITVPLCAGARCCRRLHSGADFTPHTIPATSDLYLWNEKVLGNYFCKSCGIFTYIGDGENARDGYRVNLGCSRVSMRSPRHSIIDGKVLSVIEAPG